MREIELLFDLIPSYPGLFICLIEDDTFECSKSLADFCNKSDATLHVKSLSEKVYEKSLHVDKFSYEQKSYNRHAVLYDFVFLCANIEEQEDIEEISKKIYRILKNAAYLFVFSSKNSTIEISQILEDSNFVALNIIELNDNIHVISAKKMHGWMRV